jgi:peptidyl-prolyl cis-trans isomerase SurA
VEQRKRTVAHRVRSEHRVTVDTTRLLTATGIAAVDSLARPLLSRPDSAAAISRTVATLGDSTYTVGQMARHLMQTDGGAQTTVAQLIESFLNKNAVEYAAVQRSLTDPSLAREIRKYREGTLLFRYMQDSVWTAAAQDSAGLRATYRKNQAQYRFPERIRTIVFRAPADSLLQPLKKQYATGGSPGATVDAAATDTLVSVDTVFVTDRSPEVYQPVRSADDRDLVGPTSQDSEWLLMIRDTRLPPRPKTFAEARSSVVQDYQQTYEQRVIQRLRNRYNADTYPERLRPPYEARSLGQ